jgi:hypothetical protein
MGSIFSSALDLIVRGLAGLGSDIAPSIMFLYQLTGWAVDALGFFSGATAATNQFLSPFLKEGVISADVGNLLACTLFWMLLNAGIKRQVSKRIKTKRKFNKTIN